MNLAQQRQIIVTTGVGFIGLAVVSLMWSVGSLDAELVQRESTFSNQPRARSATLPGEAAAIDSLDYALLLQKSLYDRPKPVPKPKVVKQVPKPAPPPPKPKPPRIDWTLVGTIINDRESVAILEDGSGKTDIRTTGELVELNPVGVLVRSIDSDKVTLELKGTESTLRLKQSFSGGGGGNRNKPRRGNR